MSHQLNHIINDQGISTQEGFGDPSKIIVAPVFEMPGTSIAVDSQVPEFVRQDHGKFVQFLKTYYDWMDLKGNTAYESKRIKLYADIDTSKDEYEDLLHDQFLINIPRSILSNKAQTLKHIRDFYRAKGTEKSFKFFFRTLYNSPAEFYYPRQDILRLSDGQYVKQRSIRVQLLTGNASDIQNSLIFGTENPTSSYVDKCRSIVSKHGNYYELFLNRSSISGDFNFNEVITGKDTKNNVLYTAKILPVISKIDFETSTETGNLETGEGYQLDDSFLVESLSGRMAVIKVTSVGENGSIRKINVKDFGVNYSPFPFVTTLQPLNSTPKVKYSVSAKSFVFDVSVEESSVVLTISGFRNKQEIDAIETYFIKNSSIRLVSEVGEKSYLIYNAFNVFNTKLVFYLSTEDVFLSNEFVQKILRAESISGSGARVKITPGIFCDYEGYNISNNGQLSETKYLHDGEFYQQFSYIVYNRESAETYRSYLKDMVHPLGLKFYGGFRDPSNVESKAETPTNAPVVRKFQQYPRQHLFFDVPVPHLIVVKNGKITSEGRDYTLLPRGNSLPYNKLHFSVKMFGEPLQSTDQLEILFRDLSGVIKVKTLQHTTDNKVYSLPFDISSTKYESLLTAPQIDKKAPQIEQSKHIEKSPALDGIKTAKSQQLVQMTSKRSSRAKPLGACLWSIYKNRFRSHPNTNMKTVPTTIVNDGTYWGNLSSPGLQYANTQIRHFKHLIPKSLESGDVPDILVVKNGKILADNLDYIIVGKHNNPWSRPHYCIRLLQNTPIVTGDIFEVVFRDETTQRVLSKRLSLNLQGGNTTIVEIPHSPSLIRPETRINIMPDGIVSRGTIVDDTP
jgi:hypothetical protein